MWDQMQITARHQPNPLVWLVCTTESKFPHELCIVALYTANSCNTDITQRFWEPGNSSISDADILYSVIKYQLPDELFSLVSLVRELKLIKPCEMKMSTWWDQRISSIIQNSVKCTATRAMLLLGYDSFGSTRKLSDEKESWITFMCGDDLVTCRGL